jgi:elongation factor G
VKQYATAQLRNVALLSHAGAGKTMLSEAMLFDSGAITRLGRVEDGTTTSDFDADEIKHKISVNNAVLPIEWRGCKINLIDTPGYADFVGDIKSAVRVVDAAIVVVCGASGVEVGTEQVWGHANEAGVPRLIAINRLDRERSDFETTLEAVRQRLSNHAIALQLPLGQEHDFSGAVDLLSAKAYRTAGGKAEEVPVPAEMAADVQRYRDTLIEAIAETDDDLVNKYLEGEELGEEELRTALRRAVGARQIFPVVCCSGTANINIPLLLDAIVDLLPSPDTRAATTADGKPLDGALAALVFKTVADPFGKLSLFRVYAGTIKADSHVYNVTRDHDERIGQLLVLRGKNQEAVGELTTGDIGAALRLQDTLTGDTLATKERPVTLATPSYPLPSFAAALEAKTRSDLDKLSTALTRLTQEDPTLQVSRDARTGQMILSGMGESHLNIAVERLHRKYQVDVLLSEPRVPYRETITSTASERGKHKRQTGGHGQYGDVEMEVSPLPRGAGFEFVDNIVGGAIPRNFIPAVQKGIEESLPEGVLTGNPVVDVRVRIYDGSYHAVDSSEQAFKIAASMGFKKALEKAHPILLEPIMEIKVTVPSQYTGDVMGDLNSRRARIQGMEPLGNGMDTIAANVPMAEVGRYATSLRSLTQGRGSYTIAMIGYEEVPPHITQTLINEFAAAAAAESKEHR